MQYYANTYHPQQRFLSDGYLSQRERGGLLQRVVGDIPEIRTQVSLDRPTMRGLQWMGVAIGVGIGGGLVLSAILR